MLVRKDSDAGDVFIVDTTNSSVTVSGNLQQKVVSGSKISYTGSGTTVSNATLRLIDITVATDTTVSIFAHSAGIESDLSTAYGYVRIGTFKNDSGTVTQVGTTSNTHNAETANADMSFSITGTLVTVKITGSIGNTVSWTGYADVIEAQDVS